MPKIAHKLSKNGSKSENLGKIDQFLNMFELYQSGDIIDYLDDDTLKKFILKLRSNIVYNRIGLRDMYEILKSIISKNLNLCFRIHPEDL